MTTLRCKPTQTIKTVSDPIGTKYSHTVWGVDINGNPLVAINGSKHFNSVPVPVYKKVYHLH